MTDIENDVETVARKWSLLNSTDECRSRTTSVLNEQTIDYDISPSVIVPPTVNETMNEKAPLFSIRHVYKNLIIMCIAFTILFTAYSNILSLQSSLNTKGNVGVNSLIVLNGFALVSLTRKKTTFYIQSISVFKHFSLVHCFSLVLLQIYSD